MSALIDNTDRKRFEMLVEDRVAFVDYALRDNMLILTHTEVPPALGGKGVGSALVRAVLEEARDRKLKVISACSFVSAYMQRHPELSG